MPGDFRIAGAVTRPGVMAWQCVHCSLANSTYLSDYLHTAKVRELEQLRDEKRVWNAVKAIRVQLTFCMCRCRYNS